MLLEDIVSLAKCGDEYYKQYLYEKYLYIAKRFYYKNKDNINFAEVEKIYKKLLSKYLKEDNQAKINVYLSSKLEIIYTKNNSLKQINITKLISQAKLGDKDARDQLINHYSYIVKTIAMKHHYMEYEDLVQCGMVKLITVIDNELLTGDGSLFSPRIIKYINFYFDNTLKNEIESNKAEYEYKIGEDDFLDKLFEIELEDLINSINVTPKDKLYAIKHYIEKMSLNQISDIYGCSKQCVSKRIIKVNNKLKIGYEK